FSISENEFIDIGFAKFNTIVTSLKVLDESFSSNNYVRKFLRALRPKWRAKFTAIQESNYLSSLSLDELIDNLKVHEMIMEKDFDIVGGKREKRNSLSLKAKKESSDDENSMSESANEEYSMVVRDFKRFFMRRGRCVRKPRNEKKLFQKYQDDKKEQICFRCKDLNHLIRECPKLPRNKDQRAFVRGSWAILMKQMKKRQTMKRVLWINHLSSHKDGDSFLKDKGTVAPSIAEDKTVTNLKSKLKYLVVNKVRVPIATENEVKQFYKHSLKPRVGF
ncbi:zf-CCHC domain-containing protein, partial [Tanacetum coccineum]